MSSWGFESAIFRQMTAITASLLVALGAGLFAALMAGIGATAEEKRAREAAKACMTLAMFGAGVCFIALSKAALMYLGV